MDSSPFKAGILEGKVAVITGGGSGIGLEISTQFGLHGAAVAIMGRRKLVLDSAIAVLQELGIRAIGVEGDVRKKEDAARVMETTFKHFGRIDILVNGAAGNFLASPEDLSPNAFRTDALWLVLFSRAVDQSCHHVHALNCHKFICSSIDCFEILEGGPGKDPSAPGGLILNISATLHYTATWYQLHVSAAKAAVDSITRSLALEWGTDYDIRVNGIAPGPIAGTPGMSKLLPEELDTTAREISPLYKVGERWDIAVTALFLASNAGKYVNGMTIAVDGGLWLSKPRYISKEMVQQLSRAVERRSRTMPVGVSRSKL